MAKSNVRQPQQKRSIIKKERIIGAALKLFFENGYQHTSVAEIAKAAGVSTGIVYNYFPDKTTLLVETFDKCFDGIVISIFNKLNNLPDSITLNELVTQMVDMYLAAYGESVLVQEITLMIHSDKTIREYYSKWKDMTFAAFLDMLSNRNISPTNAREKVLIAYNLIESICNEQTYYHHTHIDYGIIKIEAIEVITNMLSS